MNNMLSFCISSQELLFLSIWRRSKGALAMIGDISFFSLIDKIKLKFNPLMAKYDLKLSSMDSEAYINVLELFYTLGEELSRFSHSARRSAMSYFFWWMSTHAIRVLELFRLSGT